MLFYGWITISALQEFPFCLYEVLIPDIQEIFFATVMSVHMGNKILKCVFKKELKITLTSTPLKIESHFFIA